MGDSNPMSINYVMACWSGMRRVNPKKYIKNRAIFLQEHFKQLQILSHSISQITVVVNHNPEEPPEFRDFLNSLPPTVRHAQVVLIERPNVGFSYGGYSDVFAKYRTSFSHYILMEDDYTYVMDDFDAIMMQKMEDANKCGFVSFWNAQGTKKQMLDRLPKMKNNLLMAEAIEKYFPEEFYYPRIALGLMNSKMLDDVYTHYGTLPYASGANHGECKIEGQFGLSVVGQKFGWSVEDLTPEYGVVGFGPLGEIQTYNPKNKEIFVKAIQAMI